MSEERLFYVKKNDSWHTYDFLERRKYDPKWRKAFLEAEALLEQEEKKRKRRNFFILLVSVPAVLLIVLVGLYFYGTSGDEEIPKREVSLNESTASSTEIVEESETLDTSSVGQVLITPWGEQVTVLRILPNGERVINESPTQSDLNNDGVLTFEELSQVEEELDRAQQQYQQQSPQQGQNNQQQTPQQRQDNGAQQQNQQETQPSQSAAQQTPSSQEGSQVQEQNRQNQ